MLNNTVTKCWDYQDFHLLPLQTKKIFQFKIYQLFGLDYLTADTYNLHNVIDYSKLKFD